MIANSIPARLVATRMRVALPRACTCHCYAHAHGHTMRACARPYHAHAHGYDMVRAELWKRCPKPSWQALTPLPLLSGNAHMEKTHFKKGLPFIWPILRCLSGPNHWISLNCTLRLIWQRFWKKKHLNTWNVLKHCCSRYSFQATPFHLEQLFQFHRPLAIVNQLECRL